MGISTQQSRDYVKLTTLIPDFQELISIREDLDDEDQQLKKLLATNCGVIGSFLTNLAEETYLLLLKSAKADRLKPIIEEKAKKNKEIGMTKAREKNPKNVTEQILQNSVESVKKTDTQKELAKTAGVSHDTIYKTEKIKNEGTDEQIENRKEVINNGK